MANDVTNSNGRVTADEVIHKDSVFRYQLLDRLRSDCEYYLNYGNRHPKSLWAGDEKLQIEFMIKLHESFKEDEKPEWLTMDEIFRIQQENDSSRRIKLQLRNRLKM